MSNKLAMGRCNKYYAGSYGRVLASAVGFGLGLGFGLDLDEARTKFLVRMGLGTTGFFFFFLQCALFSHSLHQTGEMWSFSARQEELCHFQPVWDIPPERLKEC